MILRLRTLFGFLALLSLFSCGGGGSVSRDDSPTGGNTGGANVTRSIQLAFTDASGQPSTDLSEGTPLTLTAMATDSNGDPVVSTLITYSFQPEGLAVFGNDSGTASTDASGMAIIDILVGASSGAGEVVATLSSGETAATTFNSAGKNINALPASLDLFSNSTLLASSGSDEIELIALVKDKNNVLLEGVDVTFSANSGASIKIENGGSVAVTGVDGIARALLNTQNKPENRTIVVTANAAGLPESQSLDIQVLGTVLAINGPPSVILGESANFTVFLSDFDGVGIANQEIQLNSQNGNDFEATNFVTDGEGQVLVKFTGSYSGMDVITASALNTSGTLNVSVQQDQFSFTQVPDEEIPLGTSKNIELTWLKENVPFANGDITLTTTRGTLSKTNVKTNSSGKASFQISSNNAGLAIISAQGIDADDNVVNVTAEVEFIATHVSNMILSASPNSIGPAGQKSTITAVLRDAAGNLVKGKVVNFTTDDVSSGQISPASAITDGNGLASTVYTSLNVTSEDGITVSATEPSSGIASSVNLTVANRAQFISIGTGNIIEAPDETSYLKKFTVFVTDANSNPVSDVELTVTGTPVKYTEFLEPNAAPDDSNFHRIRSAFYKGYWVAYPSAANFEYWTAVQTHGCPNEDVDDDGIKDPNEDKNGDGELTPGNIMSIDGDIKTDENGQAIIELRYAKTYAAWGQVKITASTPVSGSESQASYFYTLSASAADLAIETTPPNSNPFGTGVHFVEVENPEYPGDDEPNPTQIPKFITIDDGANRTCDNSL
ncbi:Ig-like domain-containing protein [uncultured Paraglaciecola sp.]|uniref:Ig-like domain-containing protein n=1 Tax=uncultured Paraglaciecola sp. TaxID=1765024 RepID=UPI0026100CE9|nr:Ig-like domain-containing protein [uncultured Paraglaciecola sp.]